MYSNLINLSRSLKGQQTTFFFPLLFTSFRQPVPQEKIRKCHSYGAAVLVYENTPYTRQVPNLIAADLTISS